METRLSGYRDSRSHVTFNRTTVGWKPEKLGNDFHDLELLLIAPQWDGNIAAWARKVFGAPLLIAPQWDGNFDIVILIRTLYFIF